MTLAVADNVDICVTCVTNKPPKLPLREELVSLGVEVIYNARGIGTRAVKSAVKKKVKDFHKAEQDRERKKFWWFLPKSGRRKLEKEAKRKEVERELRRRKKSLSYGAYAQKLLRKGSDDSSSLSSWESQLTWGSDTQGRCQSEGTTRMVDIDYERRDDSTCQQQEKIERKRINRSDKGADSSFPGFHGDKQKRKTRSEDTVDAAFNVVEPTFVYPSTTGLTWNGERDNSIDFNDAYSLNEASTLNGDSEDATKSSLVDHIIDDTSTIDAGMPRKVLVSATGDRWWYDDREIADATAGGAKNRSQGVSAVSGNALTPSSDPEEDGRRNHRHSNWAASTFNSIADEFFNVSGSEKNDNNERGSYGAQSNMRSDSPLQGLLNVSSACGPGAGNACAGFHSSKDKTLKKELFTALSKVNLIPDEIRSILDLNPSLAESKMRSDGRLPLHNACARKFPNRFKKHKKSAILSILDHLVDDITLYRAVIEVVAAAWIGACHVPDKSGDLPVHLLARQLIEWESDWHVNVRKTPVYSIGELTKLTRLHQEMALCIDAVLGPIATSRALCRRRGSVGRVLPLHIASIFLIQYDTLEKVLATYPEAAAVPCDFHALESVFTSDALPLELLEFRRNQNFSDESVNLDPKGDIGNNGIKWTQSTMENGNHAEDLVRRSDLIFAFYPNILPFRRDPQRIQRIESQIRVEAKLQAETQDSAADDVDPAVKSAWLWMCTFDESMGEETDNYTASVERIVTSLDTKAIEKLSLMKTYGGQTVIEMAIPPCADIISRHLEGRAAKVRKPASPCSVLSVASSVSSRRSILRTTKSSENFKSQRLAVNVGSVAKRVFNVKQCRFPTSFVILPYKLRKNEDGSLALESPSSADAAVKFAQVLLDLTQSEKVQHILQRKAFQCVGHTIPIKHADEWTLSEEHYKFVFGKLLALYQLNNEGFLYLLDETNGVPIVPVIGDARAPYPISIKNPSETIRKVLPLMLMGMVLMRGEKALSILLKTMLEETDQPVPEGWITASQDVVGYLYSQNSKGSEIPGIDDTIVLKDKLIDFVSRATDTSYPRSHESPDGSEWIAEVAHLKLLLDRFDPLHTYCGLKGNCISKGNVIWSVPIVDKGMGPTPEYPADNHVQFDSENNDLQKTPTAEVSTSDILSTCSEITESTIGFGFSRDDESRDMSSVNIGTLVTRRRKASCRPPPSPENPDNRSTLNPLLLSSTRDSLDFDENMSWRKRLESQEAYLEVVREKLTILEVDETYLVGQGEPLLSQLAEDLSFYDQRAVRCSESDSDSISVPDEMSATRKVLLRLCGLEERLLSREIELQQLKLDLHAFSLDAVRHSADMPLAGQ